MMVKFDEKQYPKVSIIMPAYNAATSCEIAINSVLNQEYENFELIIIDDGSTDDTYKICEKYSIVDSRIKLIHQNNGGVSKARNTGLLHSSGEYTAFIDSDDSMESQFLKLMVTTIIEQKADIAICGYTAVSKYGESVWKPTETIEFASMLVRENGLNMLWNKLFKTALITHRFNESSSMGEDLEFVVTYFENVQSVALIDESLYNYAKDTAGSLTKKIDLVLASISKDVENRERFLRLFNANTALAYEGVPGYLFYLLKKTKTYHEFIMVYDNIRKRQNLLSIIQKPFKNKKDRLIVKCIGKGPAFLLYLMTKIKK